MAADPWHPAHGKSQLLLLLGMALWDRPQQGPMQLSPQQQRQQPQAAAAAQQHQAMWVRPQLQRGVRLLLLLLVVLVVLLLVPVVVRGL